MNTSMLYLLLKGYGVDIRKEDKDYFITVPSDEAPELMDTLLDLSFILVSKYDERGTTTIRVRYNNGISMRLARTLTGGCTVFSQYDAQLIRKLHRDHPEWVRIIPVNELEHIVGEDEIYDEHGRLAYFGAILTPKGIMNIEKIIGYGGDIE